jgi:hypothetical protein
MKTNLRTYSQAITCRRSRRGPLARPNHSVGRGIVSRTLVVVAVAVATGSSISANAAAPDATRSDFTTIDLKTCKTVRQGAEGSVWQCVGLRGYPVYVAEGDDRFFVSVGASPEKRRAAKQTLKPFNTLFQAASPRTTIEWRVPRTSRKVQPYATIIRYYISNETGKSQVLVVSKVTPTETCQVALIDAQANADAIERARLIADTTAKTFDCKNPPTVEGAPGKPAL